MHKNIVATLLGAMSAVFMVSTAGATDQAAAPAGFNWSGFYVGVGGGFGASSYKPENIGAFSYGGQGQFGELTIGYDHMLTDRILLGGFIDTHVGNTEYRVGMTMVGGSTENVWANNYGFDVVARLGYVLNGSTLGYLLGGYTWERFKMKNSISFPPFISTVITEHQSRDGFVLGTGMETAVRHNWTIKAEYRYSSYGYIGPGLFGAIGLTPSTHTFHIAANYRFGAGGTGLATASPGYDWTGFYLGAAVGAGELVDRLSMPAAPIQVYFDGYSADGVFGELDAGYDHDFGNLVAGIMVGGNLSGISNGGSDVRMDYGFDILGRIGLKVNPSTLAYVLGGYSWANFKVDDASSLDWSSNGFSVGGGLETAIATHTTLGLEYRYAQYAKEDFDSIGLEIKPSSHTVRVGIKYKVN